MKISKKVADNIGKKYDINFNVINKDEWYYGLNVELEHGSKYGSLTNITNNNIDLTARIVIAHLLEAPDYYMRLKRMENNMDNHWSKRVKPNIFL